MCKKIIIVLFAAIMIIVMLSACNSNSGSSSASIAISGSETSSKDTKEKMNLVVWDTFSEDAMNKASEEINNMYQETFTNVTIERISKTPDAMDQTMKAAFMSGDAPDVIYHEMGIGAMGSYVKAGNLLNLADAYNTYGWNDTLMSVSSEVPTADGFIYGVGSEIETMGLYYNKTVFDKLGLETPATIEELADDFAVIKEAGYIPLANTMGSLWYSNMNTIGTILYSYMTADEIEACMNKDASWDLPSVRNAAGTIKGWLNKGYFPDHPEVDGEERDFFLTQNAICWISGNWSVAYINENLGDAFEAAIIPFPGSETCADGGSQVNFVGSGYMVSASSRHQKEALDYIDFCLNNAETSVVWAEVGNIIPPFTGEYDAKVPDMLKLVYGYLSDKNISNVSGINMWLGKNSFDFYSTAGQKMAIDVMDADSFIVEAEVARNEDIKVGNTKGSFTLE